MRTRPTTHLGDQSECVQIDFDPTVISYARLVDLMLALHDPTAPVGDVQYASLILTEDAQQLAIARERTRVASAKLGRPLATRIEPLKKFWLAEDYHQKFYLRSDGTFKAQFTAMFGSDDAALRDSSAAMRVNGYASGDGTSARLAGEIGSFGLAEAARKHLVSLASDTPSAAGCILP